MSALTDVEQLLLSELRALRVSEDGLSLDLRLIDPQGRVLVEIEDYRFRRARLPAENLRHRCRMAAIPASLSRYGRESASGLPD